MTILIYITDLLLSLSFDSLNSFVTYGRTDGHRDILSCLPQLIITEQQIIFSHDSHHSVLLHKITFSYKLFSPVSSAVHCAILWFMPSNQRAITRLEWHYLGEGKGYASIHTNRIEVLQKFSIFSFKAFQNA